MDLSSSRLIVLSSFKNLETYLTKVGRDTYPAIIHLITNHDGGVGTPPYILNNFHIMAEFISNWAKILKMQPFLQMEKLEKFGKKRLMEQNLTRLDSWKLEQGLKRLQNLRLIQV